MNDVNPFQLTSQFGSALNRQKERSQLDEILENSMRSNDPQFQDDMIRKILYQLSPEKQQQAIPFIQNRQNQIRAGQQQQNSSRAFESLGLDPQISSLDPSIQKEVIKSHADKSKKQADLAPAMQGLEILKRQRELLNTGHLGSKVGILGTGRDWGSTFSSEGQKARSEYERLGKALISLSSNIPIRNKQEFEVLAHDLYDPTKNKQEIEGIITAMERIIKGNLGIDQSSDSSNVTSAPEGKKERPPLSSFNG